MTFFINNSYAQFIETNWTVKSFAGNKSFAKPNEIIGKTQSFYKGWSDGVFYSCDYSGQTMTYNKYTKKEFLNNKEFSLFKKNKIEIEDNKTIFVHRISCNGNNKTERKVFYPFITIDGSNRSYYLFEDSIYLLEYKKDLK